jgi:hypothetical protein
MGTNTQTVGFNDKINTTPHPIFQGWSFQKNTIIALTGMFVSPAFVYDDDELNGTGTIGQNYFDPTGFAVNGSGPGHLYLNDPQGSPYAGTIILPADSVNMVTGASVDHWP